MELTIRDIPEHVDMALRAKAESEGKTLNDVAVAALAAAATTPGPGDFSDIAGTWIEDPEFDAIMREQDQIDRELWK